MSKHKNGVKNGVKNGKNGHHQYLHEKDLSNDKAEASMNDLDALSKRLADLAAVLQDEDTDAVIPHICSKIEDKIKRAKTVFKDTAEEK